MKTTKKLILALALVMSAAAVTQVLAELDLGALRRKLPEKITPLTAEQVLSGMPNFYYFDYPFDPQPGKRLWIRVSRGRWIERYPDGLESSFRVLGHACVEDTQGTMLVKVSGDEDATGTDNNGGLQCFIPDKGSAVMHHWYRNSDRGDTKWNDLGEMKDVN